MSIKQASEVSSLSKRFLYQKIQNRELKGYKIGKRIVIEFTDLINFITREPIEPVEDWSEKLGLK